MSDITLSSFSKAVYPVTFTEWVEGTYQAYPDMVPDLGFEVKGSDRSMEEITLLSGMGHMIVSAMGDSVPYDTMQQQVTKQYLPVTYRLGFAIAKQMIEDGKGFDIVAMGAREFGRSYADTRNIVAAAIHNGAYDGSIVAADGTGLCSASHPNVTGGNQSNLLAVAAPLSEASLEESIIEMKNIKNNRGLRMQINAEKLIVPTASKFAAERILGNKEWRPATADRDINALAKTGMFPMGYQDINYLTSSTAFQILTDVKESGLVFWDRKGLELGQDVDFSTDNVRHKAYARMMPGVGDYRRVFGTPGA